MSFALGQGLYTISVDAQGYIDGIQKAENATKKFENTTKTSTRQIYTNLTTLATSAASLYFQFDNLDKVQIRVKRTSLEMSRAQEEVNKLAKEGKKGTLDYQQALERLEIATDRNKIAQNDFTQAQIQLGLSIVTTAGTMASSIGSIMAFRAANLASGASTLFSAGAIKAQTISMLTNPIFIIPTAAAIAAGIYLMSQNMDLFGDSVKDSTVAIDSNTKAMGEMNSAFSDRKKAFKDDIAIVKFWNEKTQEYFEENKKKRLEAYQASLSSPNGNILSPELQEFQTNPGSPFFSAQFLRGGFGFVGHLLGINSSGLKPASELLRHWSTQMDSDYIKNYWVGVLQLQMNEDQGWYEALAKGNAINAMYKLRFPEEYERSQAYENAKKDVEKAQNNLDNLIKNHANINRINTARRELDEAKGNYVKALDDFRIPKHINSGIGGYNIINGVARPKGSIGSNISGVLNPFGQQLHAQALQEQRHILLIKRVFSGGMSPGMKFAENIGGGISTALNNYKDVYANIVGGDVKTPQWILAEAKAKDEAMKHDPSVILSMLIRGILDRPSGGYLKGTSAIIGNTAGKTLQRLGLMEAFGEILKATNLGLLDKSVLGMNWREVFSIAHQKLQDYNTAQAEIEKSKAQDRLNEQEYIRRQEAMSSGVVN